VVSPILDLAADALYDPIVNKGIFFPNRKDAKDAARQHGDQAPIHHGPHEPGQRPHYHAVDRDGNKLTGEDNVHFEHPEILPLLFWWLDHDKSNVDKKK
jgi:hypothetical protein